MVIRHTTDISPIAVPNFLLKGPNTHATAFRTPSTSAPPISTPAAYGLLGNKHELSDNVRIPYTNTSIEDSLIWRWIHLNTQWGGEIAVRVPMQTTWRRTFVNKNQMTTFAAAADDVRFSVKLLLFGKCKIVSVIVAWSRIFIFRRRSAWKGNFIVRDVE